MLEVHRELRGGHLDSALRFPYALQSDLDVLIALQARELISPLYQQDAIGREEVVEAKRFQASLGIDAVEINMVQSGTGSAVFVDEGKGRAGHILGAGSAEAFGDALYQSRFSRSELAAQQHD